MVEFAIHMQSDQSKPSEQPPTSNDPFASRESADCYLNALTTPGPSIGQTKNSPWVNWNYSDCKAPYLA